MSHYEALRTCYRPQVLSGMCVLWLKVWVRASYRHYRCNFCPQNYDGGIQGQKESFAFGVLRVHVFAVVSTLVFLFKILFIQIFRLLSKQGQYIHTYIHNIYISEKSKVGKRRSNLSVYSNPRVKLNFFVLFTYHHPDWPCLILI